MCHYGDCAGLIDPFSEYYLNIYLHPEILKEWAKQRQESPPQKRGKRYVEKEKVQFT
jgi:hypothetical protein